MRKIFDQIVNYLYMCL